MKTFGERLKAIRKENNLSCDKLGEILKVSGATINRWENDKMNPTIDDLYNIAVHFKISANYLIGLED